MTAALVIVVGPDSSNGSSIETSPEACFPGATRVGWSEELCSHVTTYFNRSVTAYGRSGIASDAYMRHRGHRPRVALRREIHPPQEVLKAREGTRRVRLRHV